MPFWREVNDHFYDFLAYKKTLVWISVIKWYFSKRYDSTSNISLAKSHLAQSFLCRRGQYTSSLSILPTAITMHTCRRISTHQQILSILAYMQLAHSKIVCYHLCAWYIDQIYFWQTQSQSGWILVFLVICIHPISPPPTTCDTRSIFKRSTAGLNWKFSF